MVGLRKNLEFVSRSTFQSTPAPPLVSTLLPANGIALPNSQSVLSRPFDFSAKAEQTKSIYTGYLHDMFLRFTKSYLSLVTQAQNLKVNNCLFYFLLFFHPVTVDSFNTISFYLFFLTHFYNQTCFRFSFFIHPNENEMLSLFLFG